MLKLRTVRFTLKRLIQLCLCIGGIGMMSVIAIDRWIAWQAQGNIITHYHEIGNYPVVVVLGTSKFIGKKLNSYYSHRIEAAIDLHNLGRSNQFLLTGDNAHRSYNEPWTMKRDLLKAGVPEESIHLDYAGFRTLDSIVRAKEVFDTSEFLIITQRFHCERALFLADAFNIQAQCLAVAGPIEGLSWMMSLREILARTKAVLDVYVLDTQPKFLGPKHPILQQNQD